MRKKNHIFPPHQIKDNSIIIIIMFQKQLQKHYERVECEY